MTLEFAVNFSVTYVMPFYLALRLPSLVRTGYFNTSNQFVESTDPRLCARRHVPKVQIKDADVFRKHI